MQAGVLKVDIRDVGLEADCQSDLVIEGALREATLNSLTNLYTHDS